MGKTTTGLSVTYKGCNSPLFLISKLNQLNTMHLTTEQQIKSDLITEISLEYFNKTQKLITAEEFDFLYDKSVSELIEFAEFYKNKDEILRELAAIARDIMRNVNKGE